MVPIVPLTSQNDRVVARESRRGFATTPEGRPRDGLRPVMIAARVGEQSDVE